MKTKLWKVEYFAGKETYPSWVYVAAPTMPEAVEFALSTMDDDNKLFSIHEYGLVFVPDDSPKLP